MNSGDSSLVNPLDLEASLQCDVLVGRVVHGLRSPPLSFDQTFESPCNELDLRSLVLSKAIKFLIWVSSVVFQLFSS